MPISVRYPQIVGFGDGTRIRTNDHTWKERRLVVETDRSEAEIRDMLYDEGFGETSLEYPKSGRLGSGMTKKFDDWQVHVRLFPHGGNIQLDGEVEVESGYLEHLTHGWLPAFDLCADMVRRHFGGFWAYHKKRRRYVTDIVQERTLRLGEPGSKTGVGTGLLVVGAALGLGLLAALSKKD